MKDQANSPTLDKMLQGAKFRTKQEYAKTYFYQITRQEYGMEVIKYFTSTGREYGFEGFVDEDLTKGNTLVVVQPILTKTGRVEINTDTEIEIIEA
jgi:hypothetical protein